MNIRLRLCRPHDSSLRRYFMQKSLIRGTVLALCVAGIPAFAAVYKEAGGRVVIEAEHFDARTTNTTDNHVWQIVPDENGNPNTPVDAGFANARGGKYMQTQPDVLGGNLAVHNTVATVGIDPHLDFKVQIGTPGDYRLWLRWGGYDGSSDSVYAQILELQTPTGPGPDWYRYVGQALVAAVQDFNTGWNGVAAPSADLANRVGGGGGEVPALWWIGTPGVYTIRLSMREDGSAVDALILQLSSLSDPDNPGPAESTIVGAADTSGPTIIDAWTGGNPNGAF